MRRAALLLAIATSAAGALAACGDDNAAPSGAVDGGTTHDATTGDDANGSLCTGGTPTSAWPPGPYAISLGATLPAGLSFEGPDGPVNLADYYEPCAARSRLLVIRSAPAWCGSCGWHVTHTTRLLGAYTDRVRLVDLLLADEDNLPPDADAAGRWHARVDVPNGLDSRVGIDAKYTFEAALQTHDVLPGYLLVDTRTMRAMTVQSNPSPETLISFVDLELAALDGAPRPDLKAPALHDGHFSEDQWDLVHAITLPGAPPADPTNEVADSAAAATLGQALYADTSLSPSKGVACVTCHDPKTTFGDGLPVAVGVAKGDRNAPSIALAAHARWQFWDGRADTLWAQAVAPFENDREIASSRLFVAHGIADRHAAAYAAAFGTKYPLPDLSALPAAGKPGDAAYDALTIAQRDDITRVLVNAGKAIAAFERTFRVAPNPLDNYVAGDLTALSANQKDSLREFFVDGCIQCHWGPRLTDDAFHAIGFPTGRLDGAADRGRVDVLFGLAASEFAATSKWSDSPASAKSLTLKSVPGTVLGAFKTPTLRGVATSGPYGHGGVYKTLADVAKHYGQRGDQVLPGQSIGTVETWLPKFDVVSQGKLPALLDVLTAEAP